MKPPSELVTARLRRRVPILVCRKCLKRMPGGGALRRALKDALKLGLSEKPQRKPKIVITSCFGICPKRAIVLASGATLERGECVVLAREADAKAAATILLPGDAH